MVIKLLIGMERKYIVCCLIGSIIFLTVFNLAASILVDFIACIYPGYMTFKALETKSIFFNIFKITMMMINNG